MLISLSGGSQWESYHAYHIINVSLVVSRDKLTNYQYAMSSPLVELMERVCDQQLWSREAWVNVGLHLVCRWRHGPCGTLTINFVRPIVKLEEIFSSEPQTQRDIDIGASLAPVIFVSLSRETRGVTCQVWWECDKLRLSVGENYEITRVIYS